MNAGQGMQGCERSCCSAPAYDAPPKSVLKQDQGRDSGRYDISTRNLCGNEPSQGDSGAKATNGSVDGGGTIVVERWLLFCVTLESGVLKALWYSTTSSRALQYYVVLQNAN